MLFRRVLVLVSAVAVMVLTGCGTPALKATRTMAVTVEAEPKTRPLEVKPLTQIDLTLPPVDEGLIWQISFHDGRYLQQVRALTAGTGGAGATVSFITLNSGRTRLRFLLLPKSDGRVVAPVDQQEIVMSIQP